MYLKKGKVFLHVDMNSFYASVEVAQNPSLIKKPLAIAGNEKERKGIIITCTYEARNFGIYTTMPLWKAKQLCPKLEIKEPNFPLYQQASLKIFNYLKNITPLVEKSSIDEWYLDITNCQKLGSPIEIAKKIQLEILKSLKLPCSIGIAPNKYLAKTASSMKKPLGIQILRKRDVPKMLWPLKIEKMHGIGKKTAKKLNKLGIHTIQELAQADEYILSKTIGIYGPLMKNRANGIDNETIDPNKHSKYKSIGNFSTFPTDITKEEIIFEKLNKLSQIVTERLKSQMYMTKKIQITIKYNNRKKITRSQTLPNYIIENKDIFLIAQNLWTKNWIGKPVRLLGITAHNLSKEKNISKQLDLFSIENVEKETILTNTLNRLNKKYGDNTIKKGCHITNKN